MMSPLTATAAADPRLEAVLLRHEIDAFNTTYAATLDEQRLMDWAELFTDDALYAVLSRENFERNLPASLIYCDNKGMIRDRAFALQETAMFAPRYLRHMISNLSIGEKTGDGAVAARANYVVLQVLLDRPEATLHQVGTYYDKFRRTADGLRLAERRCVYDNLLVPNALCVPV
jgi:anthranilate 1,2-dioxygenase small subunit